MNILENYPYSANASVADATKVLEMVVQGFGMALIITPLTAVALGSVEGEHSGLASGVNNAAARVAAPLAVAVLGVFVYGAFSASLDVRVEGMNLPGEVRSELEAAKADLGAAKAPEGVDARTKAQIEGAIEESFVAGFRTVMVVCVGLALMSALAAALLVGDHRVRSASGDSRLSGWPRERAAGVRTS